MNESKTKIWLRQFAPFVCYKASLLPFAKVI